MCTRIASIQFGAMLVVSALLIAPGCTPEDEEPISGECPPGTSYQEDLDRCVVHDAGVDNASNDQEDADPTPGEDAGSDDGGGTDPDDDAGTDGGPDDAGDDASNGDDPAPCDDVDCGANASCDDGDCYCDDGYEGDPYDQCFLPPPCDGDCSWGATCIDDQCLCDPGFVNVGDGCEREEVSDPADRTQQEVCQRWTEDPYDWSTPQWADEPDDECDWGWLSEEYHLEAIRETTRYRWLVGLPAVTTADNQRDITQACATVLNAEGVLTHDVEEDFACYTQEGASGAGSSNIAVGASPAADTVRLYIEDIGVPSLGHRRWVFNPSMGATAFGMRGSYSCMYAFDSSGDASPEFTAYPAPGYFPADAHGGRWSLASSSLGLSSNTEVEIENLSGGESISAVDIDYHGGGMMRPPMISWAVTSYPDTGETLQITIGDDDLTYQTTLVNCQ